MMNNKPFIFTEVFNCGEIAKKCLETYSEFHNETIHVFGTYKDFKEFPQLPCVEYIEVSGDLALKEAYQHGHLGTGYIFAKVIQEYAQGYDYIIHIDSDIIFRKESLSLLQEKIDQGYDLIGPYRCYKNNLNGRKDLGKYKDVTQTYFFAFNKNKISNYDFNTLHRMCTGYYCPANQPILDFFDPVGFDILRNNGKIAFLNYDEVGGMNEHGDKANKYDGINKHLDFGDNLIHFAGVGSGRNFYKNPHLEYSKSYVDWSKGRYALYQKAVYNQELPGVEYNKEILNEISKYYEAAHQL